MASDMLEVNSGMLWVRDEVVVCSEAGFKTLACFGAKDEVAVCSRAEIEDDRWRRSSV
jgi:hypothetical protein